MWGDLPRRGPGRLTHFASSRARVGWQSSEPLLDNEKYLDFEPKSHLLLQYHLGKLAPTSTLKADSYVNHSHLPALTESDAGR